MTLSEWPTTVPLTGLIFGLFILWWRSGWKFTWLSVFGRIAYEGFHYLPWRRKKVDETLALWQSAMVVGSKVTTVHRGQIGRGLTAHEIADLEQARQENLRQWENSAHLQAACDKVVKMRCIRKALGHSNPFNLTANQIRFFAAKEPE